MIPFCHNMMVIRSVINLFRSLCNSYGSNRFKSLLQFAKLFIVAFSTLR